MHRIVVVLIPLSFVLSACGSAGVLATTAQPIRSAKALTVVTPLPAHLPSATIESLATSNPRPTLLTGTPRLEFVVVPGYRVSVQGRGWGTRTEVTFVLQANPLTRRLILRATDAGTFIVGITNIDMCSAVQFAVHDAVHTVTLASAPTTCPPAPTAPTPLLSVLQGS